MKYLLFLALCMTLVDRQFFDDDIACLRDEFVCPSPHEFKDSDTEVEDNNGSNFLFPSEQDDTPLDPTYT